MAQDSQEPLQHCPSPRNHPAQTQAAETGIHSSLDFMDRRIKCMDIRRHGSTSSHHHIWMSMPSLHTPRQEHVHTTTRELDTPTVTTQDNNTNARFTHKHSHIHTESATSAQQHGITCCSLCPFMYPLVLFRVCCAVFVFAFPGTYMSSFGLTLSADAADDDANSNNTSAFRVSLTAGPHVVGLLSARVNDREMPVGARAHRACASIAHHSTVCMSQRASSD